MKSWRGSQILSQTGRIVRTLTRGSAVERDSADGGSFILLRRPESEMAAYRELIRESFEKQPVRTIAEACERVFQLTGLRRGPSQVRKFLKEMGLKFLRVRPIPVPPKKPWPSTSKSKQLFTTTN
jgi:hypothetical protein